MKILMNTAANAAAAAAPAISASADCIAASAAAPVFTTALQPKGPFLWRGRILSTGFSH